MDKRNFARYRTTLLLRMGRAHGKFAMERIFLSPVTLTLFLDARYKSGYCGLNCASPPSFSNGFIVT